MQRRTKGGTKRARKEEATENLKAIREEPDANILAYALGDDQVHGRLSVSGRKRSFYRPDDSNQAGDLEEYNVEEEKEKLRKEEEAAKKAIKIQAQIAGVQSQFGILNTLTAEEIENHYSTCIQMCSQNKVTSKNAFKLQLIDYMKMILSKRSTKSENLSLMSCTLDASAKIYSYRVDKVYNDMLKLVSFKGKKPSEDKDTDNEGTKSEGDEEEECQLAKKKKKKKRNSAGDDDDEDEEGADGDLMNDTKMLQAWEKVLGDEKSFQRVKIEQEVYTETLPRGLDYFLDCPMSGADFKLTLDGRLIEKTTVQPTDAFITWSPFDMDQWEEDLDLESALPGYDELKNKFHIIDDNGTAAVLLSSQNSNAYYPSADLSENAIIAVNQDCSDDDMGGCFDEEDAVVTPCDTTSGGLLTAVAIGNSGTGEQFIPALRASILVTSTAAELDPLQPSPSEASSAAATTQRLLSTSAAFDAQVLKNSRFNFWGGPKHWRLRPVSGPRGRGRMTEKKSKKDKSLRFTEPEEVVLFSKKICDSAATKSDDLKLCKKTIASWCEKSNLFSPEVENLQRHIFSFFNCESILMVRIKTCENSEESKTATNNESNTLVLKPDNSDINRVHQMSNCNDEDDRNADGVCSDDGYEGNDRDVSLFDRSADMFDQQNLSQNSTRLDENALIPVPQKVEKIKINYCKAQKRIDIKLVKRTLWGLINLDNDKENECQQISQEEQLLPAKRKSDDFNSENMNSKQVKFSDAFQCLKRNLPNETSQELSFPIAFMSLLHLANEKNLNLIGTEKYDDVNVSVNNCK